MIEKIKISDHFTTKVLTKVSGRPTFVSIMTIHDELCENAVAIESDAGGGNHGLLGMITTASQYATYSATPFMLPDRPSAAAAVALLNAADARQETAEHAHRVAEYETATTFAKIAKTMLLNSIEPQFLRALREPIIGFRNRSIREIFAYLLSSYGRIEPIDAANAVAKLNDPIDPTADLAKLWTNIRDTMVLSTACEVPMSDAQVLMIAHAALQRTGRYKTKIDDWDEKPAAEKTFANMQTFFNAEQIKQDADQSQTAASFGTANLAEELKTLAEETANALTDIDEVNQKNLNTILEANKQLIETVKSQQGDINTLKRSLNNGVTVPTANYSANTTTNDQVFKLIEKLTAAIAGKNSFTPNRYVPKEIFYCWSHGFGTNKDHTSCTCNRKSDGHINNATAKNRQGGSIKNAKRFKINV